MDYQRLVNASVKDIMLPMNAVLWDQEAQCGEEAVFGGVQIT